MFRGLLSGGQQGQNTGMRPHQFNTGILPGGEAPPVNYTARINGRPLDLSGFNTGNSLSGYRMNGQMQMMPGDGRQFWGAPKGWGDQVGDTLSMLSARFQRSDNMMGAMGSMMDGNVSSGLDQLSGGRFGQLRELTNRFSGDDQSVSGQGLFGGKMDEMQKKTGMMRGLMGLFGG